MVYANLTLGTLHIIEMGGFKKWIRRWMVQESKNLVYKNSSKGTGLSINLVIPWDIIPKTVCVEMPLWGATIKFEVEHEQLDFLLLEGEGHIPW